MAAVRRARRVGKPGRPGRVLLVEDDPSLADMYALGLPIAPRQPWLAR